VFLSHPLSDRGTCAWATPATTSPTPLGNPPSTRAVLTCLEGFCSARCLACPWCRGLGVACTCSHGYSALAGRASAHNDLVAIGLSVIWVLPDLLKAACSIAPVWSTDGTAFTAHQVVWHAISAPQICPPVLHEPDAESVEAAWRLVPSQKWVSHAC